MLASFLLPTRKRPAKLLRAVKSIHDSTANKANYEICIRIHWDDRETIAIIPELQAAGNCVVRVGPPLDWSRNIDAFNEAYAISSGSWVSWFNDDCVYEGHGWDTQLWELGERTIAIPETHRLGQSTYHKDRHVPFFFMPAASWGAKNFPLGGDAGLWEFYEKQGWSVYWLNGITLWHDRDEPDCRRINDL